MRTTLLAIGLLVCGGLLAGCANPEPGDEVDSTTENITISATTYDALGTAARNTPGCTIHDGNNNPYALVVSGESGVGTYSTTIQLYDITAGSGSQNVTFGGTTTITNARAHAQLIANPSSTHECLLVGGDNAGTAVTTWKAIRLTLSGTPGSLMMAVADEGTGLTAAFNMAVARCDTTIIAVGGDNGGGTALRDVYVFKGAGNGWATLSNILTVGRSDFQLTTATDGSHTQFMVSGGKDASGAWRSEAETLIFSQSVGGGSFPCDTVAQVNMTQLLGTDSTGYTVGDSTKTHGRGGSIAFEKAYTAANGGTPAYSEFIVGGGIAGTTVYSSSDDFYVRWDTGALFTTSPAAAPAAGPALTTAVHHSGYLLTSGGVPVFVGGATNSGGTASSQAEKWTGSAFANATSGTFTARVLPALAEVASTNVVALGGDNSGPVTTVQVVTTP